MRLAIDGGSYATAASAYRDANQVAALDHDSLTGKLGGYAAMAGDDTTSITFATAYDEAAAEAVGALADLVDSFASLGRLTEWSLANHHRAEVRSVIGGAIVYDGTTLPPDGYVTVLPATPPSSLGGDPAALSAELTWVLDHVEGFLWPNADTDRLRDAAHTWRTAAEDLDHLATYCDGALRGFSDQRSPEIPVATAATEELRSTVRDVAGQYAALATACEAYAAQVDEKRAEILSLGREILAMVVEGLVISAAIGLITAGAGAAAGSAAVLARIASQSPRFAAILAALRTLTAGTASSVRAAREALRGHRLRLEKFKNARLSARTEAGAINPWARKPGWLREHERARSHTFQTHIGHSREELLERARSNPKLPFASSFTSEASAEAAISRVLANKADEIERWLRGGTPRLRLDGPASPEVGISVDRNGQTFPVSGIRAILVRDSSMSEGFRILTSFPQP